MSARPESEFPTLNDLRACLDELIARGFGELPVQILVVPDSTLQAIAADAETPALMIDFPVSTERMSVGFISTRYLDGGMQTRTRQ